MYSRVAMCLLVLGLAACGSDSPTAPALQTHTYSFSLTDPTRCNCGDGIAQYTVEVGDAGTFDATATWTPADAQIIVRLLDSSFNTVFGTSTATGATAKLSLPVTRGTYRMQVFLGSSGSRTASFQLTVKHP